MIARKTRFLLLIAYLTGGGLRMTVIPTLQAADRPAGGQKDELAAIQKDASTLFLGVGSCAAAACHGSATTSPKGGEYTIWIQRDPHATAWTTLHSPKSREIARKLKLESAHTAAICLNCHSPDAEEKTARPTSWGAGSFRTIDRGSNHEGVSCEACHGAAGEWLEPHKRTDWKDIKSIYKINDTKDALHLTNRCVRCHVGAPGCDVDHDLIAAGHPRLYFEAAAYLEKMPAHWIKKQKRNIDLEARLWAVGQFVAADAAVSLLEYRASSKPKGVWPEFAENSCFGCHHDLGKPPSWRQNLDNDKQLGEPKWGAWHFALARGLTHELAGEPAARDLERLLVALQLEMAKPVPRRDAVQGYLAPLRKELQRLAERANGREIADEQKQRQLMSRLFDDTGPPLIRDWEGATQTYLGLTALAQSQRDVWRKRGGLPWEAGILNELRELRDTLRFPKGDGSFEYLSPQNFDKNQIDDLELRLQRLKVMIDGP